MKAMVCRKYGTADVLRLDEIDDPVPGRSELLVRVIASSVNAIDVHFMQGRPILVRLQYGLLRPKNPVLGYDIAGRVERVGEDVTRFRPGDEVFGGLDFGLGGFADYACVPEDGFVGLKPSRTTFEQAAAVPGAAVAALIGLRDRGRLQAGHSVLINGASGGTGTFAVQIARALGAEVTGVCSTRNADMVRRLGADVVDYTREDFAGTGRTFDLLLDNVGNRSVADMLRVVRPGGTVVVVGFTNMRRMQVQTVLGPRSAKARGVTWAAPSSVEPGPEHAAALADLLERGEIVPEIEDSYPLERLPEAMAYMETGHVRAKQVITI